MVAEIIGTDGSAKAIFYLSNHRGDTILAYRDDNGTETLVARYLYDAFGNRRSSSYCYENPNETANLPRFTFSTKEYLSDAKLYLYAYRVYDPIAGRWTQRDPIDYQDSVNLYQFCGNNPVNVFDVLGLAEWIIAKGRLKKALQKITTTQRGKAIYKHLDIRFTNVKIIETNGDDAANWGYDRDSDTFIITIDKQHYDKSRYYLDNATSEDDEDSTRTTSP